MYEDEKPNPALPWKGAFILKGFDPVPDAADYGKRLLPLVRDGVARIDATRPA